MWVVPGQRLGAHLPAQLGFTKRKLSRFTAISGLNSIKGVSILRAFLARVDSHESGWCFGKAPFASLPCRGLWTSAIPITMLGGCLSRNPISDPF